MAKTKNVKKHGAPPSKPSQNKKPMQEKKANEMPDANETEQARRSVSEDGLAPVAEGRILHPVDKTGPKIDSDDWPCFVLEDAIVYKNGNKEDLCSVLHVELEGPLTIEGKLDLVRMDKNSKRQILPTAKNAFIGPVHIVITGSNEFSCDEDATIWASGNSGWFEIRPAARYKPVFEDMQQGIRLFYDIYDIYSTRTKSTVRHKLDVTSLFQKYKTTPLGKTLKDCNAFKDLLGTHTKFLLGHMKPGSVQSFEWSALPVFRYLKDTAPEIYKSYYGDTPIHKLSISEPLPVAQPRPSADFDSPPFENFNNPEVDQSTMAKNDDDEAFMPAAGKNAKRNKAKRAKEKAKKETAKAKGDMNDSDNSMGDAEPIAPKTPAKAAIPKSQYAGKGSTRRPVTTPATSAANATKYMDDDDDDEQEDEQPTVAEKKRRFEPVATVGGRRVAKKSKKKAEKKPTAEEKPQEEIEDDIVSLPGGEESEVDEYEEERAQLRLEGVPLGQSIKPNAPRGFWICERPECGHLQIPFAASEAGKHNIRMHWLWHAKDLEEKTGIVSEYAKPYLNCDNLVAYFQRLHKTMWDRDIEIPNPSEAGFEDVQKDPWGRVINADVPRPARSGYNVSPFPGRPQLLYDPSVDHTIA